MKLALFVLGGIPLLVQFYARKYLEEDRIKTLTDLEEDLGIPNISLYDFIVVGGGTAGCVVAGRLSEKFNVLLLEAGGTPVPQTNVPFYKRYVADDPDINFLYKSQPQKHLSLANDGILSLALGKMLGGSGSHNEMIHNRGSPHDYDGYATLTTDLSWRYINVLKYFKKSENFIGKLLNPQQADYYGTGGPLTVDTHLPPIISKWFEAGRELGFNVSDPNGFQIESFAPFQKLIEKGKRVSTYTGYILPYEGIRSNLTVIRYAEVSEILINKSNRVYGVAFSRHGIPQIAHASKEVILSAGTINSPLILMKSGVGPVTILKDAGIPVKVNLPGVGENLQDHVYFFMSSFSLNGSSAPFAPKIRDDQLESEFAKYLKTGKGVFGELQVDAQAFLVSSRAKADGQLKWPDSKISIMTRCPNLPLTSSSEDEETFDVCFLAELQRPRSKGRVTLNSTAYRMGITDYQQLAVIDTNTFSDRTDLDVLVEGIELIFKVIGTKAFKSMGAIYKTGSEVPACSAYPFGSKDYWKCCVRQYGGTDLHLVGTNKMGTGPMAVTDSKFRVRGVNNLRVVDASILPELPNANTNAVVILVAEKASDEVYKTYKR